jgi:hypothetical protein
MASLIDFEWSVISVEKGRERLLNYKYLPRYYQIDQQGCEEGCVEGSSPRLATRSFIPTSFLMNPAQGIPIRSLGCELVVFLKAEQAHRHVNITKSDLGAPK